MQHALQMRSLEASANSPPLTISIASFLSWLTSDCGYAATDASGSRRCSSATTVANVTADSKYIRKFFGQIKNNPDLSFNELLFSCCNAADVELFYNAQLQAGKKPSR